MNFTLRKIGEWFWRHRVFFTLAFICLIGIGFRVWHYSDALIFQSDQSRDALIVERALSGGGFLDLPLLGPQARGSNLHLGPVFYYFQYISGKIFGTSPEVFAYPDLVLGILTLPLLYILARMFFGVSVSLYLTALASTSLLLLTFSRFAWNPNSLPFFATAFAVCFLRALQSSGCKRWFFIIGAALSFGIIAQLHFIATLGLALALGVFMIWKRSFSWPEVAVFFGIVIMLHTPVLLYEYRSHGGNTQAFIESVDEKGSQDKHSLIEQTFRAYQEQSRIVWLVMTGKQNTDMILTRGFQLKCDKKCDAALPYSLAAMLVFGGVLACAWLVFRTEKDPSRRKILTFIFLWFGSFFAVTVLVAYQISTRFYLGIIPPLFILLGFSIERLMVWGGKYRIQWVIIAGGIVVLILNVWASTLYLQELAASRISNSETGRDLVFGTENKVTLGQIRDVARVVDERIDLEQPIFISGESRYVRSLYYILSVERNRQSCYVKGDASDTSGGFNHVSVSFASSADNKRQDSSKIPFGTLTISLDVLNESNANMQQVFLPKDCFNY